MKKIILCCIICLFNLPAVALDYNDFPPNLQQLLDQRTADLNSNKDIYIAGRVTMSDGARIRSGEDIVVNLSRNGEEPLWVYEDGWFMMDRPFSSRSIGSSGKLVLRAFGYEPNDMFIKLLREEITYVEFVMHKVPPEKLASVAGIVTDDQNRPLAGASVKLSFPYANYGYRGGTGYTYPHMVMTTGPDGRYSFEGLSVATHYIMVSVPGYAYHQIWFTPPAGETVTKDLKLYPDRNIIIDYVYQEDGNRSFAGENLKTGTIEWVNGDEGVDFSEGKVKGYEPKLPRDIEMRQDQNELYFQIFYFNGKQNGFYDAGDVGFEFVTEAAQTSYSTNRIPCVIGHTYVVKTYENNYAKFVVKNISGSE